MRFIIVLTLLPKTVAAASQKPACWSAPRGSTGSICSGPSSLVIVMVTWNWREMPAREVSSCAGISRQFHVTMTITNDEGPLHIEPVLPRGALQHAGFWLAAATVFGRSVRTIINRIDLRARLGELLRH